MKTYGSHEDARKVGSQRARTTGSTQYLYRVIGGYIVSSRKPLNIDVPIGACQGGTGYYQSATEMAYAQKQGSES